jgi:hypothetical protein
VCDLEAIGAPSIFKVIRKASALANSRHKVDSVRWTIIIVNAKTMMIRKANEELKERPSMCCLGRSRRKKYEGRDKERCGVTITDETRKWYKKRPRGKIDCLPLFFCSLFAAAYKKVRTEPGWRCHTRTMMNMVQPEIAVMTQ